MVAALPVVLLAAAAPAQEPSRSFWEALAIGAGGGFIGGLATLVGAILAFRGTRATIRNTKEVADRVDRTTKEIAQRSDTTTRELAQLADERAESDSTRAMIRDFLQLDRQGDPVGLHMLQALARTEKLSATDRDRLLVEAAIAVKAITRPVIDPTLSEARSLEETTGEAARFYVEAAAPDRVQDRDSEES